MALKYERTSQLSTLNNGVRVATESNSSPLTAITVLIKAGSRDESLDSSGVSHLVKKMLFRGTANRTREQIEDSLNEFGNNLECETDRETTRVTLTVANGQSSKALDFLMDLVVNSSFAQAQIDAEKP